MRFVSDVVSGTCLIIILVDQFPSFLPEHSSIFFFSLTELYFLLHVLTCPDTLSNSRNVCMYIYISMVTTNYLDMLIIIHHPHHFLCYKFCSVVGNPLICGSQSGQSCSGYLNPGPLAFSINSSNGTSHTFLVQFL